MGPSAEYLAQAKGKMAAFDAQSPAEQELIREYGPKKALQWLRLGRGTKYAAAELARLYGPPLVPRRKRGKL